MGDTRHADNPWSAYLYRRTRMPGWTITRLATESGLARQTISDWINKGGERGGIKLETILAIARAVNDHPVATFIAAADLIEEEPQDREIGAILSSDLSDAEKRRMIGRVEARRSINVDDTIEMIQMIRRQAS